MVSRVWSVSRLLLVLLLTVPIRKNGGTYPTLSRLMESAPLATAILCSKYYLDESIYIAHRHTLFTFKFFYEKNLAKSLIVRFHCDQQTFSIAGGLLYGATPYLQVSVNVPLPTTIDVKDLRNDILSGESSLAARTRLNTESYDGGGDVASETFNRPSLLTT